MVPADDSLPSTASPEDLSCARTHVPLSDHWCRAVATWRTPEEVGLAIYGPSLTASDRGRALDAVAVTAAAECFSDGIVSAILDDAAHPEFIADNPAVPDAVIPHLLTQCMSRDGGSAKGRVGQVVSALSRAGRITHATVPPNHLAWRRHGPPGVERRPDLSIVLRIRDLTEAELLALHPVKTPTDLRHWINHPAAGPAAWHLAIESAPSTPADRHHLRDLLMARSATRSDPVVRRWLLTEIRLDVTGVLLERFLGDLPDDPAAHAAFWREFLEVNPAEAAAALVGHLEAHGPDALPPITADDLAPVFAGDPADHQATPEAWQAQRLSGLALIAALRDRDGTTPEGTTAEGATPEGTTMPRPGHGQKSTFH